MSKMRAVIAPVVLVGFVAAAAATAALGRGVEVSGVGAQASATSAIVSECERALVKRTFDEATAAGLNPGAFPVSFDAKKASTTKRNGKLIATGTASYRPTPYLDEFDVRYECVADATTGKVESVTYAGVDAAGAVSQKPTTTMVRERLIVKACRAKVDEKVSGTAIDKGLPPGGTGVELNADAAAFAARGTTTDVSGGGRIRLSADYEWQPVTFTCRYDEKKKEAKSASYALDRTAGATTRLALPPEKERALDACRYAVEDEVLREGQRQGYRSTWRVRIDLKPGATFTPAGADLEVKGSGEYKLDYRHQPTPLTFTCLYDTTRASVKSARYEAGASNWTPSGDVATGTTRTLICESTQYVQKVCPAEIKGSVKIVRQRGRVPCEAYKNWIWSLSGITVWGGCRAEFEYEARVPDAK